MDGWMNGWQRYLRCACGNVEMWKDKLQLQLGKGRGRERETEEAFPLIYLYFVMFIGVAGSRTTLSIPAPP